MTSKPLSSLKKDWDFKISKIFNSTSALQTPLQFKEGLRLQRQPLMPYNVVVSKPLSSLKKDWDDVITANFVDDVFSKPLSSLKKDWDDSSFTLFSHFDTLQTPLQFKEGLRLVSRKSIT